VKELIWNSWPTGDGWDDERPPTPSHLRVLHLGRMLQDEDTLKACNFPIHTPPVSNTSTVASVLPAPTIVHLAIRPTTGASNPADTGDLEKKKNRSRLARFGSVLSNSDGGNETHVPNRAVTGVGNAAAQEGEDSSHGCSCCVVC